MSQIYISDDNLRNQFGFYVPILVENDQSWERLKAKYPEILADLTSSRFNPTCSCRNRVASFLNEKFNSSEEDRKYLGQLFLIPEIAEKAINIINDHQSQQAAYENFPKVHTIKRGENSWKEFLNHLNKNNFHITSFSVLNKDEEHVTVYLA